jgi:type IV pilus assembly protein PilC
MTFSPAQLTRRADFYYQLNQYAGAGLGVVAALQQLRRNPPARSYRSRIDQALEQLGEGKTFSETLAATPGWLPAFDVTLIEAGEKSGRMDQVFRLLAEHYSERATLAKRIIADLAYPAFLLHFAILIFPFPHLFVTGDWLLYLRQVLTPLIPIYAFVALLIYLLQSQHGETWRAGVERVLGVFPVLGTAQSCLALARLSATLEALLSAGVSIVDAWEQAAAASGSPAFRRTVRGWREFVRAGQTPAEMVSSSSQFPSLFSNQYMSGEISGTLEETLRRLHHYYQDEGSRKLHAVCRWVPMAIYLAIVGVIAFKIISFYTGYFQQVRDASGGLF